MNPEDFKCNTIAEPVTTPDFAKNEFFFYQDIPSVFKIDPRKQLFILEENGTLMVKNLRGIRC